MQLSGPFKMPRTKRGAVRQHIAILRAARRSLKGGLSFGMDWPTFKANFGVAYAHLQAIRAAFPKLPE